jgi:hypothetical protein
MPLILAALLTGPWLGCGGSGSGGTGTGGAVNSGGAGASGGSVSSRASSTGGSAGGVASSGGASSTTSSSAVAGSAGGKSTSASGGDTRTGGTSSSSVSGGTTSTGGQSGATTGSSSASGGSTQTGGSASGGKSDAGGTSASGGKSATGGTSASSGATGGTSATGGSGGNRDAGVEAGTTPTGDFDPCPTNGDPCKILPLGDSITLGTNYGGGYRVKLFSHAMKDKKNITFVGYDTANPPSASALSALGSDSSKFVNKHEGHFAWTIQQVDDLITGVAKSSQDGVNYTGKKIVADAKPHIVLIHLGSNDVQVSAAGDADRLAKLVDHVIADAPDALIVLSTIIPLPAQASNVTSLNQAVPGIVTQRADQKKHIIFADQYAGFSGKTDLMDSVHPYEAGYEQMAVVWYDKIKSYLH